MQTSVLFTIRLKAVPKAGRQKKKQKAMRLFAIEEVDS